MTEEKIEYSDIEKIIKIPVKFRKQSHIEELMQLTKNINFFQLISKEHLSDDIHRACCQAMTLEKYEKNDIIVNFGETGEKFYIIIQGTVSILVPILKKLKITAGEARRLESLRNSDSESEKSIESDESIDLPLKLPTEKKERMGVVLVSELIDKLKLDNKILDNANELPTNPFLENEEKILARIFKEKLAKEKNELLNFIKDHNEEFIEIEISKMEEVNQLGQGDSFGELALISDRPRAASVLATSRLTLLVLRKAQFKKILGLIAEERINHKVKFLQKLPYFFS